MNNGTIYFQHPIGLWDAEPYATARRALGPYAEAVYWRIFEQIRLGNGIDSLDHILTLYDDVPNKRDRKRWQERLEEILKPEYNLFMVTPQRMVKLIDHAKLVREQNKKALEEGPTLFDINNL